MSKREATASDRIQRSYRHASEKLHTQFAVGRYHNIMKIYAIASLFTIAMFAVNPMVHVICEPQGTV